MTGRGAGRPGAFLNLVEEILERLCDLFLAPKPAPKVRAREISSKIPGPEIAKISAPPRSLASLAAKNAKGIPARIKLRLKEQIQCANCGSNYALEIDHRIPRALGGTNHPTNLRLLCKQCAAAIRVFGVKKMEHYWKRP